ncbi:MAG: DNA-protecting protein DprA [Deltaproteobacteria bacterium HGW-Deltaproteobacteria-10]|nr:MAG: DNA-protecting protein DprA [Deltaproteobacteria bacterium HGW-Deltaproteobacteria-10]
MAYDKLKYLLALKSVTGIGNIALTSLIDIFGTGEAVFSASASQLQTAPGVTKKAAVGITTFKDWAAINKDLELLENAGIQIITYQDELYPSKLLDIYDKPPLLYVKGILKKDDINIALVGSRLASTYGKYTTDKISRELALQGITVISGLARGIDSAAHRGALSAKGRTIAVMGTGLDIIYPPENKKLFAAICENGAVVSEYPPGTPPRACNFPARNRIISGMSYGVVVVEAGDKSGSLITSRLALEQGREVFAVPGSIDSPGSRGTNKLIKQGAKLIENTTDILEEILPQLEKTKIPEALSVTEKETHLVNKKDNLNSIDRQIITLLSDSRLHIDELLNETDLPPGDVLSSLMKLELDGIIKQYPGKFFSLGTVTK